MRKRSFGTPNRSDAPATIEALIHRIDALADRIANEAPHSPARLITDMLRKQIRTQT